MAIGIDTSLPAWFLGAVVTPQWCQNRQDNANYLYGGTQTYGAGMYYWISAVTMTPYAGWNTFAGTGTTLYRKDTAGSNTLVCPLTFMGNGDANFQPITEIVAMVNPAGASAMSVTVQQIATMTTSPSPTQPFIGHSSGTGFQAVALATTGLNVSATTMLMVTILSAQANDQCAGVRVKIG